MSLSTLLAAMMAATVAAQANVASNGFKYVGCIQADPSAFGSKIDFIRAFTTKDCLAACSGSGQMAALGGGCNCGSTNGGMPKYKVVDEALCSNLCDGTEESGHCGGSLPDAKVQLFNLYKKEAALHKKHDEASMDADCEEHKNKTMSVPVKTKIVLPVQTTTRTTIKTIFSCPPEVTDCPLRSSETAAPVVVTKEEEEDCTCEDEFPVETDNASAHVPLPPATSGGGPRFPIVTNTAAVPECPDGNCEQTTASQPSAGTTASPTITGGPAIGSASRPSGSVTAVLGLTALVMVISLL